MIGMVRAVEMSRESLDQLHVPAAGDMDCKHFHHSQLVVRNEINGPGLTEVVDYISDCI